MSSSPELSLVVPVRDGAAFLEANLRSALVALEAAGLSHELLGVDDGSRDETWSILERLQAEHPGRFLALRNTTNRGKGHAVRRGLLAARGRYRVFTDADFTYPVGNVLAVVAVLRTGADVAYACRVHADTRYVVAPGFIPKLYRRHLIGRGFNLLVRATLCPGILDTQAGLKGFRAEAAQAILARQRLERFSFDVETLFLARKLGLRAEPVAVTFHYRQEPSTLRLWRDSLAMLRDMALILWRQARGRYR